MLARSNDNESVACAADTMIAMITDFTLAMKTKTSHGTWKCISILQFFFSMGYIVDGALLAACIGAYRVYSDRRKSVLHSQWDSYRAFWINAGRHSTDFLASSMFDLVCHYPGTTKVALNGLQSKIPSMVPFVSSLYQSILLRASRYTIWSKYGHLGYLQRLIRVGNASESLFGPCLPWKMNLLFTSPHLLSYVKDSTTREYLDTLCSVRDAYAGIIEGSPADIYSLVDRVKTAKKNIIQDIRKGHVLDRKSESSVPMVHELRMEIESFLFGRCGPDPDRSVYIEKALNDESEGLLERLFPFLEVIVDTGGESIKSESKTLEKLSPNIDIHVPYIEMGGEVIAVGIGDREFIVCPLNDKVFLDGKNDASDVNEGSQIKVTHIEDSSSGLSGTVTGRHGAAIKVRF